ncbi:hypothetical protein D5S18_17580 [Nocardia panacis]|uniref:Uncharacterized protein n=1 Tax=Nocardia panacis TaxID=2340916 RepID=A0A3A4K802_9NOCA|nr:hypothetical protein [Nocardia panacis]RJO75174.1 hypothetical protein D5S18_17580 [Nocardia panacis]
MSAYTTDTARGQTHLILDLDPTSGQPFRRAVATAGLVRQALVAEWHTIPVARVAAMHEGKRRARARN